MDKTLSDGLRVWALHIEDGEHKPEELTDLRHLLFDAANEIDRLNAGGCARDQKTTQYCAEAVTLQARIDKMHMRMVALENAYDALQNWNAGVEADNDTYRALYNATLQQRDEARREVIRILENQNPMFSADEEKQRRNWLGL